MLISASEVELSHLSELFNCNEMQPDLYITKSRVTMLVTGDILK